ncbi:hypothetical protein [Gymnodinialimonas ulvae]|uniref:hypothetical protein n=1 Tax=Gymnodinialimonas ulvae TaxID=3126504 RepID=UPI0030EF003F
MRKSEELERAYLDIRLAKHAADEAEAIFQFEKALLWISFFSRRLFDEAKMLAEISMSITQAEHVDIISRLAEQRLDLSESVGKEFQPNMSFCLDYYRICNEIVHSKVLNWEWVSPTGRDGFFCSSDRKSATRFLFVPLEVIVTLSQEIAKISPSQASQ